MNSSNSISPAAHLIGKVELGQGNFISPGAVIIGPISIGNDNFFGPNCVIGAPPQDNILTFDENKSAALGKGKFDFDICIGNNNVIREFVTIHKGLTSVTELRDDIYLMCYAHVAHDSQIHEQVKIANNVQMGGYSTIMKGAYIGLSAVLHQFSVVGAYSMIGMGSLVNRVIPPGGLALGSPARMIKINKIALEKIGINDFEWVDGYLTNPTIENIHPELRQSYLEFSKERDHRILERKRVTTLRSQK